MSLFYRDVRDTAHRVRRIPLEEVLRATGAEQDRHDKAKWHTPQGVLSVTGVKFTNWKQGSGGGGAIDLVIHLYGLNFLAAVEWLSRHFPSARFPAEGLRPSRRPLTLPPRDDDKLPRVKRYLLHDRALPSSFVQSLLEATTLYADSRGNAVFLLLGKGKRPVGAELRGTTQRKWQGMATGSRKDLGYFAVPAHGAKAIVLCESAIDAISCAVFYPRRRCISTAGAISNPRWLVDLIHEGYEVSCGFDADQAGDRMANAMIALYPSVQRLRPPIHDWNDTLRS
jgi:hypothetical protein